MSRFIASLSCPYCGHALEYTAAPGAARGGGYGVFRCPCHSYPVVDGIPIIQQVDGLESITALIRSGSTQQALVRALNVFRITWAQRSRWHKLRYHLNCRRLVSVSSITFAEAAQLARRPKVFADYLVHRYANPSFLAAIAPMVLLAGHTRANPGRRILDMGCGAGHASFLIQHLDPTAELVSVDQDFVNVYLAKRFLAPDALFACLDGQVPSPFPSDHFDAVFCLDAFHYFRSKKAAVAELKRTVRRDGMWVFPHLHNALQENITPGVPLTPDGYLGCFDLPNSKMFNEADLLHGLWSDQRVDWTIERPLAELDQAQTLTFVHGGPRPWPVHEGPLEHFCAQPARLTLNPIYAGNTGGNHDLALRWPNPVIERECSAVTAILPPVVRLPRKDIAAAASAQAIWGDPELRALVSRFVLVPLPQGYTAR